ncbi:MAG: hypothetical protein R2824_22410 [Saprospiraceae bacterium]|nr:hypothetical protein [Lewinella sp.]
MSEKQPKKLDQLFQQGSEQYDFEYNPEAWQRMEALLDRDKRRRGLIWWWGILLLLLLAGMSWWFAREETNLNKEGVSIEKNKADHSGNDQVQDPGPVIQEENGEGNSIGKNKLESSATKDKAETTTETAKKLPNPPAVKTDVRTEKSTKEKKIKTNSTPIAAQGVNEIGKDPEESIAKSGQNVPPHINEEENEPDKSGVAELEEIVLLPLPSPLPYRLLIHQSTVADQLPEISYETVSKKEIKTNPHNFFLIGLPMAVEVTVTDTEHPTKVDLKAGLQLEYFYQGRYSISLGANYVRKSYVAGEGAYKPPVGFWTRKIAPQSTTGYCRILEVPVLIGYYPTGMLRSGFFAKAGFTSFFMLKERYYFHYDLPDEDLVKKWYGTNEYRHWFAIGQVTAGYHLKLSHRASLQLAPYFQLPLTGLGHGKVKLWSLGMSAGFNYRVN